MNFLSPVHMVRHRAGRNPMVQPNIGLDLTNTALRTASCRRCACYSVFAAQPTVGQAEEVPCLLVTPPQCAALVRAPSEFPASFRSPFDAGSTVWSILKS